MASRARCTSLDDFLRSGPVKRTETAKDSTDAKPCIIENASNEQWRMPKDCCPGGSQEMFEYGQYFPRGNTDYRRCFPQGNTDYRRVSLRGEEELQLGLQNARTIFGKENR